MKKHFTRPVRCYLSAMALICAALPTMAQDKPKLTPNQDVPPLVDAKTARAKYDELAAKVKGGDLNVDWKALRLNARVGEVYGDYSPYDASRRSGEAYQKGDYAGALKIAEETLAHNIADGDAHLAAYSCLLQLGKGSEAEDERKILLALLDSIIKSGDGKSPETAWFAVSIREEYLVMQLMLEVQFKQQHSMRKDGHFYDVVQVMDKEGKDQVLWFNTDTDIALGMRAGDEKHPIH